jgi:hypothetical protein
MPNNFKILLALGLALFLSACQMPSYSPVSLPSGSSGSSGSSGPSLPSAPSSGSSQGPNEGSSAGTSEGSSAGSSREPPGNSSGSSGETIEDLDQALDKSLEGFDDSLETNSQSSGNIDILSPSGSSEIQADTSVATLDSGNSADDNSLVEENDSLAERASSGMDNTSEQNPASSANKSGNLDNGDRSNSSAQSQGGASQPIPVPEDIGDGQGDNIVLRQIREAALKERDPVLRERLWDEYRKIKDQ